MEVPASVDRVPANTASDVNRRIREIGQAWVSHAAMHPEVIPGRLEALDREWDIERTLEANAAALCVLGVAMGALSGRKWFVVPGVVGAFLLQHAIEGWCPPLPVLRRLGFRTRAEIDEEKFALKALRAEPGVGEGRDGAGRTASGRGAAAASTGASEVGRGRGEEGRHKKKKQGEGSGARKGEERQ